MPRRRCAHVPLCDYADPLVKDLRRLVPAALKRWDEEAVHDARVATRRLRAALDLVEPMVTPKAVSPLRRTLRKLRRRLGPLRDLDVMLDHLGTMREHPRHGDAARWLSEQLEDRRKDERRKVQKKKNAPDRWLDKLDAWQPLRDEVVALGDGVEARMRSSLRSQWRAFAQQADHLAGQLREDVTEPSQHAQLEAFKDPIGSSADPHALRIAGKLLRYTFEMLAKTRRRPPAAVKRAFKRMQVELGLWHDHVVLAEQAMRQSLEALLAHHDPELQAKVLALSTTMLRQAERRLTRFAKLWREKGPGLSQIVEEIPPTLEMVREPETGPGLFDSASSPGLEVALPGATSAA